MDKTDIQQEMESLLVKSIVGLHHDRSQRHITQFGSTRGMYPWFALEDVASQIKELTDRNRVRGRWVDSATDRLIEEGILFHRTKNGYVEVILNPYILAKYQQRGEAHDDSQYTHAAIAV